MKTKIKIYWNNFSSMDLNQCPNTKGLKYYDWDDNVENLRNM